MSYPKKFDSEVKARLDKIQQLLKEILNNHFTIDTLHHSQAIQKMLKEIDILIMEDHLKTRSVHSVKKGEELDAIKEAISQLHKI